MNEIKLIYESDPTDYSDDYIKVEIATCDKGLDSLIEAFEKFIKAIGYTHDGFLDFIDYDAHEKEVTDAYERGYLGGQNNANENTPPGEPAHEMDKPKRYRVKSVEEMEKILGKLRGYTAEGYAWTWDFDMWDTCGDEVSPIGILDSEVYKYESKEGWWYIPEWVEEIPE